MVQTSTEGPAMTEKTFAFTAEQIKAICEQAREAQQYDQGWDVAYDTWEAINKGKPRDHKDHIPIQVFYEWFGIECPSWVREWLKEIGP
jgi:hypothetical protein